MSTLFGFFIVAVVLMAGQFVLYLVLKKQIREDSNQNQDMLLKLASQQFATEQAKVTQELETRKQSVENTVNQLKGELEKYQQWLRESEKTRETQYGNLSAKIQEASQSTAHLSESTSRLNNILGNVKLRGQWGERMAEDIIGFAGLVEGVNYIKQTKLQSSSTKPDFTFFLPNDHKVNMDAKFPLDNYLKMVNAGTDQEKDYHRKEFERNVKDRIKELQGRDYINPGENTLDFVLLFIPNEQVFGLIQEQMAGIMDVALKDKVVMCSPFTLYAMLSVIRQAHENFRYEKDIKKIVVLIDQFIKHYQNFKGRFEGLEDIIRKMDNAYSDIKNKSFKNLDTKIRHIEDYKKGQGKELIANDDIVLDIDTEELASDDSLRQ